MKQPLIILILSAFRLLALGQTNIFPDTFPQTKGIKVVIAIRDCGSCNPPIKNEVFSKYFFDKDGKNIMWYAICDNKNCEKQLYYYQNGRLVSYQNYGTWTQVGINYEGAWDSTMLTNEVRYHYINAQLVHTDLIEDSTVSLEIYYTYDEKGNLKKEEIKNFPEPGSIGQFKPNSDTLIKNSDGGRFVMNTKDYEYSGDTTIIRYFKEGTLSGIEIVIKDEHGKILKSTLKNAKGELLKQVVNSYNTKGQLSEKRNFNTGYDGFGNPYDYSDSEKETYEYDNSGNISIIKAYSKGNLDFVKHFEYRN